MLALLTTFVLGGASGYAARLGLERDSRRSEADAVVAAGFEELRTSLAGLQASVTDLKMRLTLEVTAPAPAREPQQPEREAIRLAVLQQLVERFERATTRALTIGSTLVIPEGRPPPIPPDIEDDSDSAIEDIRRRFQLLSYQQVLDTLGRPDKVYAVKYGDADAVLWSYIREPSAADFGSAFGLYFCDGLVIDIEL